MICEISFYLRRPKGISNSKKCMVIKYDLAFFAREREVFPKFNYDNLCEKDFLGI